jgi:hypothetical protein
MSKNEDMNENLTHNEVRSIPKYRMSIISGRLFGQALFYKSLDIYVNEKKRIDEKFEFIKGTIVDTIRDYKTIGEFFGEISDKILIINIQYNSEARFSGIPGDRIICKGMRKKDTYIGCFGYYQESPEEAILTHNNRFGIRLYDTNMPYSQLIPQKNRIKRYINPSWN